MTRIFSLQFLILMTRIMLAASSWSPSPHCLLAKIRQAVQFKDSRLAGGPGSELRMIVISLTTPLTIGLFHLDALQIDRIHHRTLKELNSGEVALYQTLEFQIGRLSVQEHNLNIHIFSIFVEEIFEKMANTFVGYMAANNNVSK